MEQARMYTDGRGSTWVGNLQLSSAGRKDRRGPRPARPSAMAVVAVVGAAVVVSAVLAGCGPGGKLSDVDVGIFEKAGPVQLNLDYKQAFGTRISSGPYKLVPGDLLELQMPAVVSLLPDREGDDTEPYKCRVDAAGQIVLPIVGNLKLADKTLSQVEATVAEQYYPKYVRQEPSIVASVVEYRLSSISMAGAVRVPGSYGLRSNEMTLIAALMKAGVITATGKAHSSTGC